MKEKEVKMFDPKEFTAECRRVRTLEDEDGTIRYTVFTVGDAIEISKVTDPGERSLMIVFLMLKKANPGLTLEDVRAWPAMGFHRILQKLAKVADLAPVVK
jgi:hypothetical protein